MLHLPRLVVAGLVLPTLLSCSTLSPWSDRSDGTDVGQSRRGLASNAGDGTIQQLTEDDYWSFPAIGKTRPIKFVAFPDNGGRWSRLVLIDPRVHGFHHEYLATLPPYKGWDYEKVKQISFRQAGRKVLLGTLRYEMQTEEGQWANKIAYLLQTEEAPTPSMAREIQDALAAWVRTNAKDVFDGTLALMPTSLQEREVSARLKEYGQKGIEIKFHALDSNQVVYNVGWGIGRVASYATAEDIEKAVDKGEITADTLLVTGSDLRELPPVAGVISSVPITEASHLVLLAQMYGIPLAYEKDAFEKRKASSGKWALMQTSPALRSNFDFTDRLSDREVELLKKLRPRTKLQIRIDWSDRPVTEVSALKPEQVPQFGGKAVQFGLLRRTIPENTSERAVAIPVSYYKRFLETKLEDGRSLGAAIQAIQSSIPANASYLEIDSAAKKIRAAMTAAKPDPKLIADLRGQLEKHFPGPKMRLKLRSSSNVEDGAEFNGAGLYESEGVCLRDCSRDDFADGLVKVWSSLFTTRGYWARQQFGVDERQVGMAILANPSFKDELFNGVVRYERRGDDNGDVAEVTEILGVAGEEDSITNPKSGGRNERVLMSGARVADMRPLKQNPPGVRMMSDANYQKLRTLMAKIYDAWAIKRPDLEIEAEWKVMPSASLKDGHVVIKQVRMVPKPMTPIKGGKHLIVTGGALRMTGQWPSAASALRLRPDSFELELDSMTDEQFRSRQFKVVRASANVLGQAYGFSVGAAEILSDGEYSTDLKIPLSHPQLPDSFLQFSLQKNIATPFVLPASAGLAVNWIALDPKNRRSQLWRIELEDSSARDSIMKPTPKAFSYKARTRETCPVQIRGESAERWLNNDEEIRALSAATVSGLLPRTIKVSGYPHALYFLQQHEQRSEVIVDLFADPSMTAAERQELLAKGGRFLLIDSNVHLALEPWTPIKSPVPGCGHGAGSDDDEGEGEGEPPADAVG